MKHKIYNALFSVLIFCCIIGVSGYAIAKDFIYVPASNALHIIDCDTDTIIKTVNYNDYIIGAALSPNKKRYYLNALHSIYAINTKTNELVDTYKFSSELSKVDVLGFAVSADSKKLYMSCSITKKKQNIPKLNVLQPQLVVYDIKKKKIIKSYDIPYGVMGAAILPIKKDKNRLIMGGLDFLELNFKTGKIKKVFGLLNPEDGDQKNLLAVWNTLSPGDHGIFNAPYYTATSMGYLLIDTKNGNINTVKGKDVFFEYSTVISPDKKYLYGAMDELIKIDLKTGKTLKMVPLERGTCYSVSLTSDGKKIYVGPGGNDLSVYDTKTLKLLGVITLDADGVVTHRLSL
jgi:DNA-binding beta-propeller fold protein YncE